MFKAKLKDLVEFRSGIYAARQPMPNILYLQVSDFNQDGLYRKLAMPALQLKSGLKKHLLKDGEILFVVKGANNYAAVYRTELQQAVASSSFLILTIKKEFIDLVEPEFISWFLNTTEVQTSLKRNAVGTSISSISTQQLSSLEITIPVKARQSLLLEVHKLSVKKAQLMEQLIQLEKILMQLILKKSTE